MPAAPQIDSSLAILGSPCWAARGEARHVLVSGRLDVSSLGTLLSSSILIFEVLLQGVDFVVEDGYDLLARDAFEVV